MAAKMYTHTIRFVYTQDAPIQRSLIVDAIVEANEARYGTRPNLSYAGRGTWQYSVPAHACQTSILMDVAEGDLCKNLGEPVIFRAPPMPDQDGLEVVRRCGEVSCWGLGGVDAFYLVAHPLDTNALVKHCDTLNMAIDDIDDLSDNA